MARVEPDGHVEELLESRALTRAHAGAAVGQRRIAAPFEAVWQVIADLENTTPRHEPGVAHMRVIEQRGEFLRVLVQDTAGPSATRLIPTLVP